jgi:hypothetical protein
MIYKKESDQNWTQASSVFSELELEPFHFSFKRTKAQGSSYKSRIVQDWFKPVLAGYCFLAITGQVGYPHKKKGKKKTHQLSISLLK